MQKALIILAAGLMAVGCGKSKTNTERIEEENRRLQSQLDKKNQEDWGKWLEQAELGLPPDPQPVEELILEEKKVIGEYEFKEDGDSVKLAFLENEVFKSYVNGQKIAEDKWEIINGEIHVKLADGSMLVTRINKDRSITWIADIINGKQIYLSKDDQVTYKKIK
jgi:hypothetical protein|tara:strand:+ start:3715 stop:4209 length:495 start_codon:yes stop_codon:yes gene_type:complete